MPTIMLEPRPKNQLMKDETPLVQRSPSSSSDHQATATALSGGNSLGSTKWTRGAISQSTASKRSGR